eukprot:12915584-Prorocentrum_lima.AAC.1
MAQGGVPEEEVAGSSGQSNQSGGWQLKGRMEEPQWNWRSEGMGELETIPRSRGTLVPGFYLKQQGKESG